MPAGLVPDGGVQRLVLATVVLLAGGCADLDVANPSSGTDLVLTTAEDIEGVIGGSYNLWYNGLHSADNTMWVSSASFQSASTECTGGTMEHSRIPRTPIMNDPRYADYEAVVERPWLSTYQALGAAANALRALDATPELGAALEEASPDGERRARAFARTVQALGHATLAAWYDQSYALDEDVEPGSTPSIRPDHRILETANRYFDEAIALATDASFTIPAEWMSVQVPADRLVALLHSWRAIFRTVLPRWDYESVDWTAVLADLDRGLTESFVMHADWTAGNWYNGAFATAGGPSGMGAESYFIIGMADQSGRYQRWLAKPVEERKAWFSAGRSDDPFLIETPDTRFPQGGTLEEQVANPGEYYVIPRADPWAYDVAEHFQNPEFGTWRWSYYYYPTSWAYWYGLDPDVPMVTVAELQLLRAEALLETGSPGAAAEIINRYRTAHGLGATDADGTNTDCVPRLPDGSCGDLMEMLKWEKRLEVESVGLFNVGWFWDARRWGDLYRGTPLQWPIPARELERRGLAVYTFGGPDQVPPHASDGSGYGWPDEARSTSLPPTPGCVGF